jgi:aminoglycoside 6'-N-acetyltransferase
MRRDYRFRKVTRADFPLLRGWLAQPHVAAWWGDAETELAMFGRDLDGDETDMRIVELGGHPFAYVQDYEVEPAAMPQYAGLPQGARGLDTFLGDPDYLGRGHGAAYLAQRAARLLERGAPVVAVDPDPENRRAVAAYRKAGFRPGRVTLGETGRPVQVMSFCRKRQLNDARPGAVAGPALKTGKN